MKKESVASGARCMWKWELAVLYVPDQEVNVAVNQLRRDISRCKELADALRATGYEPRRKKLTPVQVRLITYYLGIVIE